ncbi:MAG TPA: hypothetical protein VFK87_05130 [Steroidobacteraceae bacterium]|nr:hypothetical protein [Steroidobacteraceae bacterium]
MNAPAATLVPIFATPFAAVPLAGAGSLNPALAAALAARATADRREPAAPSDPLCYRSREDLFDEEDETVAALRREMLAGLCGAVVATTSYTAAEFDRLGIQARARFVIVRPDGCLPATTESLASWCAIYCVAAPPAVSGRADSGVLRLYQTRFGTMFMDASNWNLRAPFAASHLIWHPVAGHMVAFPASLPYEIALNRTDRDLLLVVVRARFANPGQQAMPPW